jgi:SOS-response transcriptional repressor LexA
MTRLQRRVLLFVQTYIAAHDGVAPTFVEIMGGCQIGSRATVQRALQNLHRHGRIRILPFRARAIEVLRPVEPIYATFVFDDETKALRRM